MEQRTCPCPLPTLRNVKRDLVVNADFIFARDFVIRIIPSENDRFMLIPFDFSGFDELLFFCTDALQQNRSRLIGWVLGNELALNGILKNGFL